MDDNPIQIPVRISVEYNICHFSRLFSEKSISRVLIRLTEKLGL